MAKWSSRGPCRGLIHTARYKVMSTCSEVNQYTTYAYLEQVVALLQQLCNLRIGRSAERPLGYMHWRQLLKLFLRFIHTKTTLCTATVSFSAAGGCTVCNKLLTDRNITNRYVG